MIPSTYPILSLFIVTLPVGAALIWLWPRAEHARWIALLTALVDFALSLFILTRFDPTIKGFQFVEHANWIPTINAHYIMGVDGITVLFLPLTVLLLIGVIISSWQSQQQMPRLYYTLILLLESATLSIFCALDGLLFFLFWELTLIPLFFLNSFWGTGPNRRYATVKYTLFMLVGGVPLLFGFVLLALNHAASAGGFPAGLSFDYLTWLNTPMDNKTQILIFLLLLFGFAVKIPIVPLHTWMPVVAMEGCLSVAATLLGLKLGAYGLIRFVLPLAPDAANELQWLLVMIGVIGMLYGAVVALAQTNLRNMLAFSSISHVGLVVLGAATLSQQGLQGAVFQLLNFVIASGGLFLLTGFLQNRIGSTDIISLGGVARHMPVLAGMFLLFGLASMGIPGTSGFPAEFLLLFSVIKSHIGAGLAALAAVILGAAYFVSMYRKSFMGPSTNPVVAEGVDLRKREFIVMLLFAVLIIIGGLYPTAVLDISRTTSQYWAARF
ncbi:MAG: NADH-quinone oxidoreductase subunit M [Planctomycetes bacterium]|nr:NADH-quinone oxidoreductase subunit M [Planctomycetota bacterium]